MIAQVFDMHEDMPDLMQYMDEDPHMPEITVFQASGLQTPIVLPAGQQGMKTRPEAAWGPSTQGAVQRFLTFVSNVQTRLHAAMGDTMSETRKRFMQEFMSDDLKTVVELQGKYNHLLSHHGFKNHESTTTIEEIKKTMKSDMPELNMIDARTKTLQSMDRKE